MKFVHTHENYQSENTIAAIATPPGEGGVAIVRISGKNALDVAEKIVCGNIRSYKTHTAHFCKVHTPDGEAVDNALILVMLGKKSYTGEDTVEIHCHGGTLVTRKVLECALAAGAKAALPGEFTFKAFINGKIDLAQAEAVQELIHAQNESALKAAEQQLEGALTKKIISFQTELTEMAAILEAWVDFPEEGLEFATMDEIKIKIEGVQKKIKNLSLTFHDGKILSSGINLCLAGCPNVGKSSLMNALLEKERAIVTPIAGTTRDLVEDHIRLKGLHFKITDTAGIREVEELIEQEGIRRSKKAMQEADLILFVLDASLGITEEDERLLSQVPPQKTVVVVNKMDLVKQRMESLSLPHQVFVSALKNSGIEDLKEKIYEVVFQNGAPNKDEVLITNLRHKEALDSTNNSLDQVIIGLENGVSPEFITHDMRDALKQLGLVVGADIGEDILSAIFSKFCIGK
jgi:tRNA modification GTPase